MAETTFARTFLTSLDSRPPKLSPDHVEDARNFPPRPPYILPRMPKPMTPPVTGTGTHQEANDSDTVTVSLRSLRSSPPLSMRLARLPRASTSVLSVKAAVAARVGVPASRVRLLHERRPLADSKVLGEIGDGGADVVELAVMVMGGGGGGGGDGGDGGGGEEDRGRETGTTTTHKGAAVADEKGFWDDLHGFLMQRVRDEAVAAEMVALFRGAWGERTGKS